MARDFDGTNDEILFGSDASIDGFTNKTIAFWARWDGTGVQDFVVGKADAGATVGWAVITEPGTNTVEFYQVTTGTAGAWRGSTSVTGAWHHWVVVHDGTTSAPTIYVDGSSESITTISSPTGTAVSDATASLYAGEFGGTGTADYDGGLGWLNYDNAQWTAEQINRHRWWGWKGGAIPVNHPFWTSLLVNKGTATANGTATGTTMTSAPKVERCYASMMGVGR